ncbi:cation transporter, partial [Roseibium sp. LAB1]
MSGHQKISLSVQGMSCASCVGRVERGLVSVEGLEDVGVNLATESAQFTAAPDRIAAAVAKLDDLGYPARTQTVTLTIQSMSCASCVGR